MTEKVCFGYRCPQCGQGTVQTVTKERYPTTIEGEPFLVPQATIGVCDHCGAKSFAAQETVRWHDLFVAARERERAMLETAIALAAEAHQGQKDKAGEPYILHPLRVLHAVSTRREKIVAVLHDTLEDTTLTSAVLRANGLDDDLITAIECLTRRQGETYEEFISRVALNDLARSVKLADLADNLNVARLPVLRDEDLRRIRHYQRAVRVLRARDAAIKHGMESD